MVSSLDDREIIELFFERSDQAIVELSKNMAQFAQRLLLIYLTIYKIPRNV